MKTALTSRKGLKMAFPCTRLGWHRYYDKRFDKTGSQQAEQLACWYLLLHLAFGD